MFRTRTIWLIAGAVLLSQAMPLADARSRTQRDNHTVRADSRSIVLEAGQGRVVSVKGTISSVFAADPKVIEVRPVSHSTVFIFGVGPGRSSLAAMDDSGKTLVQYDVMVMPSSYGASAAQNLTGRTTHGANVQFTETPRSLDINGVVSSPMAAEQVATAARGFAAEKQVIENHTGIISAEQVTLRVRIAEISRTITRQLGVNWTAFANIGRWAITGVIADGLSSPTNLPSTIGVSTPGGSINTVLDLLAQDQLISMLAEPNLTARSGETASFLAGGEFPIPVSGQNNQISVDFKQYGISLAFVPTVLSDGRISLHVHPEVSQLTNVGSVSVPIGTSLFGSNTITIPALTVRRADTTVELGSGQSFAIAGLLSGNTSMNSRGLPYLGELPVIGALFKSDLFQRDQSELVIVVTPYVVRPADSPNRLVTPMDDFVPAGDAGRLLLLRQRALGTDPKTVIKPTPAALGGAGSGSLPPSAGFILH